MTSAGSQPRPTYAQLRDRKRPNIAEQLPLDAPLAINLETTNACNFKCRMCPVSFDDYVEAVGGIATMPMARIERLFDEIAAWSTRTSPPSSARPTRAASPSGSS
jgi:hypothetical protein